MAEIGKARITVEIDLPEWAKREKSYKLAFEWYAKSQYAGSTSREELHLLADEIYQRLFPTPQAPIYMTTTTTNTAGTATYNIYNVPVAETAPPKEFDFAGYLRNRVYTSEEQFFKIFTDYIAVAESQGFSPISYNEFKKKAGYKSRP